MNESSEIIRLLKLKKHPLEGGYYSETYRADVQVTGNEAGRSGEKAVTATAIYYLLTPDTFSEMHVLPVDEMFHFYLGDPVEQLQLFEGGCGHLVTIGPDLGQGMRPQVLVPAGVWQGARLKSGGRYALLGTTMCPGFNFDQYLAGNRETLENEYPEYRSTIRLLTRN